MKNNMRVIRIKDVMRRDSEEYMDTFNGYHMIAYVSSQMFYNQGIGASMTTVNTICGMTGLTSTVQKNRIKESLQDLNNWGLIEISDFSEKVGNNDILTISIPDMSDSRFTSLNAEFCMKIISSDIRGDAKGNMLLLYAVLAQYTGGKDYCFPSMDSLSEDVGVAKKNLYPALEKLSEMDILIYGNNGVRQLSNGTFATYNNIYVMNDLPDAKDILSRELAKMNKQ